MTGALSRGLWLKAFIVALGLHGAALAFFAGHTTVRPSDGPADSTLDLSVSIAFAREPAAGAPEAGEAEPTPEVAETDEQAALPAEPPDDAPADEPEQAPEITPAPETRVEEPAPSTEPPAAVAAPIMPEKAETAEPTAPEPADTDPVDTASAPPPQPRRKPRTIRLATPASPSSAPASATSAAEQARRVAAGNEAKSRARAAARAKRAYLAHVRSRLARARFYPRAARQQRLTGSLELKFVIYRSGRLGPSRVTLGSGHTVLDRAALESVRRAAPFDPFPRTLDKPEMTIIIPWNFNIE